MQALAVIPIENLIYIFIPVALVIMVFFKWQIEPWQPVIALNRMVLQLVFVGFFLNVVFSSNHALISVSILVVMLIIASWISLRTVREKRRIWLRYAIFSLFFSSSFILFIIIDFVLELNPWFQARYLIPIGGMLLANAMNSISLAADRYLAECQFQDVFTARNKAFATAMIPVLNGMFSVGLVSLPGMMTGQILSGVSPLIAIRYQIMVMCMLFASSGLATAMFLNLIKRK